MLEENFKIIDNDIDTLIKDAQALFQAAAALTGEKADEVRNRGMLVLATARDKAQEMQTKVVAVGRKGATAANDYVTEYPWRAIATAGGLGLLLGLIVTRR
jgi:ElaB/YqjD/DUF883 family membrane-anchored ribosome-binding protein